MHNSHKTIYVAANNEQAHLLRNLLEDQGIFAYVSNAALQQAAGDLPAGQSIAPRVVVDESNAEEAREIALEFEQTLRAEPPGDYGDEKPGIGFKTVLALVASVVLFFTIDHLLVDVQGRDVADAATLCLMLGAWCYLGFRRYGVNPFAARAIDDEADPHAAAEPPWPACPHCQRPRETTCPLCATSGTDFQWAYQPEPIARHAQAICPICQEPFEPVFPIRCSWCGHRFADEPQRVAAPAPERQTDQIDPRIWLPLIGFAIFFIALLALSGYFARGR